MPQFQTYLEIPQTDWSLLTDTDVSALTFQVLSGTIELRRGGEVAPAPGARGWRYTAGSGERLDSLDELSAQPGNRVWARSIYMGNAQVLVDHA